MDGHRRQNKGVRMISEERRCEVCNTKFTATGYHKHELRRTCSDKCAKKLTKKNMCKKSRTIIQNKDLVEYVKETIKEIGGDYHSPACIIYYNKTLNPLDSHSLRSKVGRLMSYELGYKKISQKTFKKA